MADPPQELGNVMRIDAADGFVKVWHARSAKDRAEIDAILRAIDNTLEATGLTKLMFDSRDADRTPPEVQERIWQWLSQHDTLRKVASVMHSRSLARNVRVTSAGRGVRLRTFSDPEDARAWLLDPEA